MTTTTEPTGAIPDDVRERFLASLKDLRPKGEAFLADIADTRKGKLLNVELVRMTISGNNTTADCILRSACRAGILGDPSVTCPECREEFDGYSFSHFDEETECPNCAETFPLWEHGLFPLLYGLSEEEQRTKTAEHVRQLDLRSEMSRALDALIERHGAEGALEKVKALL